MSRTFESYNHIKVKKRSDEGEVNMLITNHPSNRDLAILKISESLEVIVEVDKLKRALENVQNSHRW